MLLPGQTLSEEREKLGCRPEDDLAAICLSGGGIRSAALCLGVMQGLAKHRLLRHFHYLSTVSGGGYIGGFVTACIAAQNDPKSAKPVGADGVAFVETDILDATGRPDPEELSNLRRFTNYLTPNPGFASPDTWAGIVLWLRNTTVNWFVFLPLFIAVAIAPIFYFAVICMIAAMPTVPGRAFGVFVGAVALACLWLAVVQTIRNLPSHQHPDAAPAADAARPQPAAAEAAGRERAAAPARPDEKPGLGNGAVFWRIIVFAILWSLLAPIAVTPELAFPEAKTGAGVALRMLTVSGQGADATAWLFLMPLASFVVSALAFRYAEHAVDRTYAPGVAEVERELHRKAFTANRGPWAASAALSAALLLFGMWLALGRNAIWFALFAPLGVIFAETMRITLYVALRRRALRGDLDREWLARLNGMQVGSALALCALGLGALLLPILSFFSTLLAPTLVGGGLLSGPATAWLGRSAKTLFTVSNQGRNDQVKPDQNPRPLEWLMYLGIVVFATALLVLAGWAATFLMLIAIGEDWPRTLLPVGLPLLSVLLVIGCGYAGYRSLWAEPKSAAQGQANQPNRAETRRIAKRTVATGLVLFGLAVGWLAAIFTPKVGRGTLPYDLQYYVVALAGVVLAIAAAALAVHLGRRIDLNNFSMHAVYRNRLVRAFLGTARNRTLRHDDRFTSFDPADDIRVADTFSERGAHPRLFPVINVALNRTSGKDTARAERKAELFTITPLHCGSAALAARRGAYIPTEHYAGGEKETGPEDASKGITLGTAITLSGAAVSPNMGYHSSPLIAFVMTLFNVRLGAWLPNPILPVAADPNKREARRSAVPTLLAELAGRSDDQGAEVYLSDGGHADNLGLYEMLRRRCTYIVVVDAGQDEDYAYFDLGTTLQHARIDMGVEVTFLKAISPRDKILPQAGAYAEIAYPALYDGPVRIAEPATGKLVLIKSWLPPGSPTDVRAFQALKQNFPHESTVGNQFFTESDFESYRRLGEYLSTTMIGDAATLYAIPTDEQALPTLFKGLSEIAQPPGPVGPPAPAGGATGGATGPGPGTPPDP